MQNLPELTVAMVRKCFPNPSVSDGDSGYCVGGALCAMTGGEKGYPCVENLAEVMMDLNNRLDEGNAMHFALCVVGTNDSSDFDQAWSFLGKALQWQR